MFLTAVLMAYIQFQHNTCLLQLTLPLLNIRSAPLICLPTATKNPQLLKKFSKLFALQDTQHMK